MLNELLPQLLCASTVVAAVTVSEWLQRLLSVHYLECATYRCVVELLEADARFTGELDAR